MIKTYDYLYASICTENVNKLNPSPNGMFIRYKIEKFNCTNECTSETYEMYLELNNYAEFIGNR